MRAMGGRPVLMQRFPKGAGGPSFFQKRVPDNAPDWLETTTVQTVNGTPSRALVAADVAHVAWAVNLACLGFHVWPSLRRRPGARRRAAPGPRPAARHGLRRGARGRLGAQDAARRARDRRLPQDDRQPRPARVRPARSRAGTPTRSAPPRSPSRASSSAAAPTSSPPPGGRRSAASGSSSTTTRTRRTRRSSARGRSAPARARRSRRRSSWDELDDVDPDALTLATVPGRLERDGDPWAGDRRRAAVARAAARAARARPRERPAGRAVAAGLPQAARRAAARRAEPGAATRLIELPRRPASRYDETYSGAETTQLDPAIRPGRS